MESPVMPRRRAVSVGMVLGATLVLSLGGCDIFEFFDDGGHVGDAGGESAGASSDPVAESSTGEDPSVWTGSARMLLATRAGAGGGTEPVPLAGLYLVEYEAGALVGPSVIAASTPDRSVASNIAVSRDESRLAYRTVDTSGSGWWIQDIRALPLPPVVGAMRTMNPGERSGEWLQFIGDGSGIMFDTFRDTGERQFWIAPLGKDGVPQARVLVGEPSFHYRGDPTLDPQGRWFAVGFNGYPSYEGTRELGARVGSLVDPNPTELGYVPYSSDRFASFAGVDALPTGEGFVYSEGYVNNTMGHLVVAVDAGGEIVGWDDLEIGRLRLGPISPDARWLVGVEGFYTDPIGSIAVQGVEQGRAGVGPFNVTLGNVEQQTVQVTWSPDGRWLAYPSGEGLSLNDPFSPRANRLVDMSGDTPSLVFSMVETYVTVAETERGVFSPDSTAYYAFSPSSLSPYGWDGPGIYRFDLQTRSTRRAVEEDAARDLVVSPSGDVLAYTRPSDAPDALELYTVVLDPEGLATPMPAPDPLDADEDASSPMFAPDGSTIVVRVDDDDGPGFEVRVYDPSGPGLVLAVEGVEDVVRVDLLR